MSKATPGPWKKSGRGIGSKTRQICTQAIADAECDANAHLIAAAPELYALLDEINGAFYNRTSRKAWLELMERTKPLLRKAQGEDV